MFSIPHLAIIFIVVLVVFGPEKLPELARNFGKVMAEFRRASNDMRSTFEEQLRELERETEDRRIGGRLLGSAPEQAPTNAESAAGAESEAPGKSPREAALEPLANAVPATPPHARAQSGEAGAQAGEEGSNLRRAEAADSGFAGKHAPLASGEPGANHEDPTATEESIHTNAGTHPA